MVDTLKTKKSIIMAIIGFICCYLFWPGQKVFADYGGGDSGGTGSESCYVIPYGCSNNQYKRPNTCVGSAWFRSKPNGQDVIIPDAPFRYSAWQQNPSVNDYMEYTRISACKNEEYVYYQSMVDPVGYINGICKGSSRHNLGGPMGTLPLRHSTSVAFMSKKIRGGLLPYVEPSSSYPRTGKTWDYSTGKETSWERVSWEDAQQAFKNAYPYLKHKPALTGGFQITSDDFSHTSNGRLKWFCHTHKEKYEPPTQCSYNSAAVSSRYFGNTSAHSIVKNANHPNKSKQEASTSSGTSGSHTAYVYAKPNDNIFFQHHLCFGAQKVESGTTPGSKTPNSGWGNYFFTYGYLDPEYSALSDPAANINNSHEQAKHGRNDAYVFGGAERLLLGRLRHIPPPPPETYALDGTWVQYWLGTPKNKKNLALLPGVSYPEAYSLRMISPSFNKGDKDNYKYSCPIANTYTPFHYQIPGNNISQNPSCKSAKLTNPSNNSVVINHTNVGRAITQVFDYYDVKAYIEDAHSNNGGSWKFKSFEEAKQFAERNHSNLVNGVYHFGKEEGSVVRYNKKDSRILYSPNDKSTYYTHKTVKAIVPYNFETSTTASMSGGESVIYTGEDVTTTHDFHLKNRINIDVNGTTPYATHTPDNTWIGKVSFIVPSDANPRNIQGGIYYGDCGFNGSTCNPRTLANFFGLNNIKQSEFQYKGGKDAVLSPQQKNRSIKFTTTIPDSDNSAPVGAKFCTASVIWPADSHKSPNSSISSGGNDNGAGSETAIQSHTWSWRLSPLVCKTIAKKPNFQVWGGGVYTNGNITTSLSRRNLSGAEHIFGSWGEHEVIAGGTIKGFASGASLGYNTIANIDWNNLYSILSFLDGGFVPKTGITPQFCRDLSPLTIANHGSNICTSTTPAGRSGIPSLATNIQTLASQLRNRYIINPATHKIIKGSPQPAQVNLTSTENCNSNTVTCQNGIRHVFVKGNAEINPYELKIAASSNHTISIYATGNIKIVGNIAYENGKYGNILVSHGIYKNLAELPQILIFAKGNIEISQNVTQIDAWLITEKGTINTCSDFRSPNLSKNDYGTDSNTCSSSIIFNSPIIARNLALNRVAGADPGRGIVPGEIFNLRPDTYLWAYNQAQLFSQANTTYIRELAPRY